MEFNFLESLQKAGTLTIKMIFVIVVVMICYEILQNSAFYKKIENVFNKPLKKIGFTANSSITMVVGIILGIAYGAGILIQNAESGKMGGKDIILSCLFLSVCHAVFEDTLIFVAVGANGFVILSVRIILAFIIIGFLNKYLENQKI